MKYLLAMTLVLTVTFLPNAQQSSLIFYYDDSGNLVYQLPYCPFCCPNNIISNGDFETGSENWVISSATLTSLSNSGETALEICSQPEHNQGWVSQKATAWTGVTYTVSVYAKATENASGQFNLIFLDGKDHIIGDTISLDILSNTYQQYTISELAPDSVSVLKGFCFCRLFRLRNSR